MVLTRNFPVKYVWLFLCKVLKIIEIRLVVDVDQLEIMRVVLLQLSLELNHVGLSNFWNQSVKKYEYVDGVM